MTDGVQTVLAWLRRVAPERYLLLLLVALAVTAWGVTLSRLPRPLEVVAFAVGDGDALLVRSPAGRTVLIDGGSRSQPEVGRRILTPNLLLLGVRRLDAVIATHPDSDHLNGLPAVLDAVPVGMVLSPDIPYEGGACQQLMDEARRREIPCFALRAGDTLNLGKGCRLRVLSPGRTLLRATGADDNNNSLVCLLEYRQARMLLTGDLQWAGEQALLARGTELGADILKVTHHGSATGTSAAFLDAVRPRRAVISTSGAPAGVHPAPDVLARLRERGVQVLRTDVHGQIHLRTDGKGWQVRWHRE